MARPPQRGRRPVVEAGLRLAGAERSSLRRRADRQRVGGRRSHRDHRVLLRPAGRAAQGAQRLSDQPADVDGDQLAAADGLRDRRQLPQPATRVGGDDLAGHQRDHDRPDRAASWRGPVAACRCGGGPGGRGVALVVASHPLHAPRHIRCRTPRRADQRRRASHRLDSLGQPRRDSLQPTLRVRPHALAQPAPGLRRRRAPVPWRQPRPADASRRLRGVGRHARIVRDRGRPGPSRIQRDRRGGQPAHAGETTRSRDDPAPVTEPGRPAGSCPAGTGGLPNRRNRPTPAIPVARPRCRRRPRTRSGRTTRTRHEADRRLR